MENWKMTDHELDKVKSFIHGGLAGSVSDEYVGQITENLLPDVVADIEECADRDWNYCDAMLALGRVLCDRCGIEH